MLHSVKTYDVGTSGSRASSRAARFGIALPAVRAISRARDADFGRVPREFVGDRLAQFLQGLREPPGIGFTVAERSLKEMPMNRTELTEKILEAKRAKNLSWKAITRRIGGASPIVVTAALLGQMKLTPAQAKKAGALLGLKGEEIKMLAEVPYRGSLPSGPPTDPLIYRFYELVQVYGTTWKELIQEEFGDGIMSAIDFDMTMERLSDPKGDRIKITMSGKFLPYKVY